jgi:hypothetical protein
VKIGPERPDLAGYVKSVTVRRRDLSESVWVDSEYGVSQFARRD